MFYFIRYLCAIKFLLFVLDLNSFPRFGISPLEFLAMFISPVSYQLHSLLILIFHFVKIQMVSSNVNIRLNPYTPDILICFLSFSLRFFFWSDNCATLQVAVGTKDGRVFIFQITNCNSSFNSPAIYQIFDGVSSIQ